MGDSEIVELFWDREEDAGEYVSGTHAPEKIVKTAASVITGRADVETA